MLLSTFVSADSDKKKLKVLKIASFLFVFFMIAFIIFTGVDGCYEDRHLKENGGLTKAHVFKIEARLYKGYCFVYYDYEVNGVIYSESTKIGLSKIIREKLVGSDAPLLYDSTNPSNHLILLSKYDYQKTSLKIPDSLPWFKY